MPNEKNVLEDAIIDQIGIVVKDLNRTVETFQQLLGIGPFKVLEWPMEGVDPQATYHGAPGNFRLLLGFASSGSLNIELVEPLEGENIYSDFMETHGPGLHHFRLNVPDFDERCAAWEQAGIRCIASGTGIHPGSNWAYFDTTEMLDGVIVELRRRLG
jgi:methylmalonyl-CoA/ethylmalonyl-CoA epimerase